MTNWQKVDPQGREALKQLDAVQRNARETGADPVPESKTSKMIDRLVKPADPKDLGGKK